jgi:hypothetical protein
MNVPPPPPARKIVQLAACGDSSNVTELYALCDDGRVYRSSFHTGQGWVRVDTSVIESGAT